ncbi:Probable myosin-binding protein 4 [Linum grandiflorum]
MAAKGSSRSTLRVFATALRSATCEWLLIFLLLVDGVFAYLLTEFSRYCRLQVPCIFCSRLDHVLGNEKPGYYYRSLICTSHQAEMSSLIFCHSHTKLADGRAMCDDCLVSFSTMLGPNSDMPRAVIGKLGYDLSSNNGPPTLFTNKDLLPGSVATKVCSCCRKPWRSRQRADRIMRLNSPRSGISRIDIPLPHRLSQQESLRKIREKFSGSLTPCRLGNAGFSYSELKFNSDSESEFLYSDDDEFHHNYKRNQILQERPKEVEQPKTLDANEIGQQSFKQGMDSWQDQGEGENKIRIPAIPEIIPLDNIPPRNLSEVPHVLKIVIKEQDDPSVLCDDSCVLSELVALVDTPSMSTAPVEQFKASNSNGLDGFITDDVNNKQTEVLKPVADKSAGGVAPDVSSTYIISLQQNETPRSGFSIQERESPQLMEEQKEHENDDTEVDHDDSNWEMNIDSSSPRIQTPPEEPVTRENVHNIDAGALECLVQEIEGESVDDRLKRQIEHDSIIISTLTRELEEERSASAIATNQTMAMITRLQAEKAALHMEALQYLRMMEEQAEYDGEELEKTNDLLAEREKELQDLEAELDHFRLKYPEEEDEDQDASSSNAGQDHVNRSNKGGMVTKSSWPDIEEEKSFIFQRLKSLERKLRKISQTAGAISPYMSDSEYSEETSGVVDAGEFFGNGDSNSASASKDRNFGGGNGQRSLQQHESSAELATVKNEISDLNERLEALETDWSVIEHAFNSLEGGKEGLQFVQEIAHHLQELRKIGLRCSRCQPVP